MSPRPTKAVTDDRPEDEKVEAGAFGGPQAIEDAKPAKRERGKGLRSLLGTDETKPKRKGKAPNITEGMIAVISYVGTYIGDKDPGVGAAIRMTAPTSGRIIAEGSKRFPAVHSFLAIFLGAGATSRDMVACIEIPRLIGTMERNPNLIPSLLPVVKGHMRPILRDMLTAARDEQKVMDEIAAIEGELGMDVEEMICVQMLGIPLDLTRRILAGEAVDQVLNVKGTVSDVEAEA